MTTVLGDAAATTPVVAAKSYFGNLGAGSGTVEMIASLLALHHGALFPVLNYETPDPECPINVVHGKSLHNLGCTALKLSHTVTGQAAALLIGKP